MKIKLIFLGLLVAMGVSAQVATITTNSLPNVVIPDGSPIGVANQITISGSTGWISNISVSLDITGGFNGDLYAYLLGPQGQMVVLLNRVGLSVASDTGYGDSGFNITLSDGASNIHNYQSGAYSISGGQLTGVWAPDGRIIDPLTSSGSLFGTTSPTQFLSVFTDASANGNWQLFVSDLSNGGQSTLVSWGLTIATVPEPSSATYLLFAALAMGVLALRTRSYSKS